jgi:hypothetical protein
MADTPQGHLTAATHFLEIAEMYLSEYPAEAVSNAIMAAIHANDAICLAKLGYTSKADDHRAAVALLLLALKDTQWANEAKSKAKGFAELLSKKTLVQYHVLNMTDPRARSLFRKAKGFVEWARDLLRNL